MMHRSRTFKVVDVSAEQLVASLSEPAWTLCTAFRCGAYLWLNDATHEDGAAEYAVVRESDMAQVESITASWCTREQLLKYARDPDYAAGSRPRSRTESIQPSGMGGARSAHRRRMHKKKIKLWCATCAHVMEFTVGVQMPGGQNICTVCRSHYQLCSGCRHG